MTIDEIITQITAYRKQREEMLKERALMDYQLMQGLSYAFNQPQKMPKAEKMYPFLNEQQQEDVKPVTHEEDQAVMMEQLKMLERGLQK